MPVVEARIFIVPVVLPTLAAGQVIAKPVTVQVTAVPDEPTLIVRPVAVVLAGKVPEHVTAPPAFTEFGVQSIASIS